MSAINISRRDAWSAGASVMMVMGASDVTTLATFAAAPVAADHLSTSPARPVERREP